MFFKMGKVCSIVNDSLRVALVFTYIVPNRAQYHKRSAISILMGDPVVTLRFTLFNVLAGRSITPVGHQKLDAIDNQVRAVEDQDNLVRDNSFRAANLFEISTKDSKEET